MDVARFRAELPVFERRISMNTGTAAPTPPRGIEAARQEMDRVLQEGRAGKPHWESIKAARNGLRERIARLMGCDASEVALTGSATDGVNTALNALGLGPGDEVLTTDEEHPGILAPLGLAQRRGVRVRVLPWDELAGAAGPRARLIACSHVSWSTGRVADTEALRATGVPLLCDGAQCPGAIPVDVRA